ncbi:hypothetical protein PoB_003904600 [Plakobranchus ocellatus]|uniref:Uncharacterized protein n=1 Tax=Plakobranchus ocellatus TaxID=259542 RepID=A0AAV4B133_9GAST|nr:hypothetical protein PoB_003904600 [Plakobranchus ocellatus]
MVQFVIWLALENVYPILKSSLDSPRIRDAALQCSLSATTFLWHDAFHSCLDVVGKVPSYVRNDVTYLQKIHSMNKNGPPLGVKTIEWAVDSSAFLPHGENSKVGKYMFCLTAARQIKKYVWMVLE